LNCRNPTELAEELKIDGVMLCEQNCGVIDLYLITEED
jgi:hypothetical protein